MNLKRAILKDPPPPPLLAELQEVTRRLALANARFDMQSDSDLIDACIYEREALCARYRYLLAKIREQGICAPRSYVDTPAVAASMPALGERAV